MKQIFPIFISFFFVFSCVKNAEESQAQKPTGVEKENQGRRNAKKETFEGLIISSNATKLRAPINYFSIRGRVSSGSWIKLKKLTPEGKKVKKGDLIGGFEFRGETYLPMVRENIAKAEARLEEGRVSDSSTRVEMLADIERSGLDSDRFELDMSRGDTVSDREMKNFIIQQELADFDVNASKRYLRAQKVSDGATLSALVKNVSLAKEDQVRFDMFKKRFAIKAPHDGVVRHARHRRRNRKIQQGDGMPSGMHFASVASDSAVEITILIPEAKFKMAMDTKEYLVKSPNGDERYPVDVVSVDSFPQTIGFIKQDSKLPNALELVYIVHGKFRGEVGGMKSGLEVKVELP